MAAACRVDRSQALPSECICTIIEVQKMQEEEVCQQQVCTCEHIVAGSLIAGMRYLLSGELEETAAEL